MHYNVNMANKIPMEMILSNQYLQIVISLLEDFSLVSHPN